MMLISNHIILRMKKNLFDSIVYYIGVGGGGGGIMPHKVKR